MTYCDYTVIGAGPAGCVVASRLWEDILATVLLPEAGGPDEDPGSHAPAGWPGNWQTESDRAYITESQEHPSKQSYYRTRGNTLGGSSSINGLICIRGHSKDYDSRPHAGRDYGSVIETRMGYPRVRKRPPARI